MVVSVVLSLQQCGVDIDNDIQRSNVFRLVG